MSLSINTAWIREVWVPALLSGNYEQGQERLRYKSSVWELRMPEGTTRIADMMCCLGVATDCAVKGGNVGGVWANIGSRYEYHPPQDTILPRADMGTCLLTPDVADFIGITWDGEVKGFSFLALPNSENYLQEATPVSSLWQLNDSYEQSFENIAAQLIRLCDWAEVNGHAR